MGALLQNDFPSEADRAAFVAASAAAVLPAAVVAYSYRDITADASAVGDCNTSDAVDRAARAAYQQVVVAVVFAAWALRKENNRQA